MSDYALSPELRGFETQFSRIVSVTHHDTLRVFDDFLTYIIGMFSVEPNPNPSWVYKKEHNVMFYDLMREWLEVQKAQIAKKGWYDTFGDFFMACVGHTSRQYRGQFFTPEHICDFMARVTISGNEENKPMAVCGGFGKREIVNDCACGSARLLLAAHAVNCEKGKRPSYFVAEDIDRMCCKMSAINLCVHGCFGEVVCHDALADPGEINIGYIINEGLYPIPALPTIRVCHDKTRFVSTHIWADKRKMQEGDRTIKAHTMKESAENLVKTGQLMFDFGE